MWETKSGDTRKVMTSKIKRSETGLCKHPLLLRGWYYDTRNFWEVCEKWEERNNANTSKGGEKGI